MEDLKEWKKVNAIIMSVPAMNELVKINNLGITRKHVLLLCQFLQKSLNGKAAGDAGLLGVVTAEDIEALNGIANDLLGRAGITELNQHLQNYGT